MKNTTVEIKMSSQKSVSVLFGLGDKVEFRNKTQAKTYSYQLKKLIRNTIISLSDFQAKVYASYRSNYLYMPKGFDSHLLRSLHGFDNRIGFVFKTYSEGNGSFVFNALDNLFRLLYSSIDLLLEFSSKYKFYALKNDMKALRLLVSNIEDFYLQSRKDLQLSLNEVIGPKILTLKKTS